MSISNKASPNIHSWNVVGLLHSIIVAVSMSIKHENIELVAWKSFKTLHLKIIHLLASCETVILLSHSVNIIPLHDSSFYINSIQSNPHWQVFSGSTVLGCPTEVLLENLANINFHKNAGFSSFKKIFGVEQMQWYQYLRKIKKLSLSRPRENYFRKDFRSFLFRVVPV